MCKWGGAHEATGRAGNLEGQGVQDNWDGHDEAIGGVFVCVSADCICVLFSHVSVYLRVCVSVCRCVRMSCLCVR